MPKSCSFFLQKMFIVPAYTEVQKTIPFSRVNHNKYMVTDKKAYIGKYLSCPFVLVFREPQSLGVKP